MPLAVESFGIWIVVNRQSPQERNDKREKRAPIPKIMRIGTLSPSDELYVIVWVSLTQAFLWDAR